MDNEPSADYCLVSKTLLEDRLLSVKAKAMYAVLCCCSPEFDCSNDKLSEILGVSIASASKLIKELEEFGYIKRELIRNPNGIHAITIYHVSPTPSF